MNWKKILIGLVVALLVIIIGGYFYIRSFSVERNGRENLSILDTDAKVVYDENAIPHIYAESETDAYRALGYIHAKDRLFQMEMTKRVASGRLAEILGKDLVKVDRFFLTIGIRKTADEYLARISKDSPEYKMAMSYLEGVNYYVDHGRTPLEYQILGIKKEHFTAHDILCIAGYMAYTFAAAFKTEPLLTHIKDNLGEAYLKDLAFTNTPNHELKDLKLARFQKAKNAALSEIISLANEIDKARQPFGILEGSNAFAVSPKRSKSGKAMLVSDPHISYAQPTVWYEAHVVTPEREIYGHYLALVPFPLLGHDRTKAWGLTMFENDDMDLYYEKLSDEHPGEYFFKGNWKKFETVKETIQVKGEDPVEFEVRWTGHGPIINDALESIKDSAPIGLKWIFHEQSNQIVEAFYGMEHATNLNDFEKSVAKIEAPGLNIMYADAKGNIAWWAAAKIPIRPKGQISQLILDGTGKDEYLGFKPFSQNPQTKNPASGIIVSANQQPAKNAPSGYYINYWRAYRIFNILQEQEMISVDDLKRAQSDINRSEHKNWLVPLLSAVDPSDHKEAQELLQNWNGDYTKDAKGATIAVAFMYEIAESAFLDELGEEKCMTLIDTHFYDSALQTVLENPESVWWDDVKTKDKKESQKDRIQFAWKKAMETLESELGSNPQNWAWGDYHSIEYVHPIGRKKPFNLLFNPGPFKAPGGYDTVYNLGFKRRRGPVKITFGPSARRVIDFSDIENAWGMLPTGQSGFVSDPYYANQAEGYLDRKYRNEWLNKDTIQNHSIGVLDLISE